MMIPHQEVVPSNGVLTTDFTNKVVRWTLVSETFSPHHLIMEATLLEATAPATTDTVSNLEPSLVSTHRASVATVGDFQNNGITLEPKVVTLHRNIHIHWNLWQRDA
jgi:hypothetical protein